MPFYFSRRLTLLGAAIVFSLRPCAGQSPLRPGFDSKEYEQLLGVIMGTWPDSMRMHAHVPFDTAYHLAYHSPEMGLYNQWDLWVRNDDVAVISIRGTKKSIILTAGMSSCFTRWGLTTTWWNTITALLIAETVLRNRIARLEGSGATNDDAASGKSFSFLDATVYKLR